MCVCLFLCIDSRFVSYGKDVGLLIVIFMLLAVRDQTIVMNIKVLYIHVVSENLPTSRERISIEST